MANNDFDDILKSAFGDEEKPAEKEKPAAAEAGSTVGKTNAASAPPATPTTDKKLPFAARGKGPTKPMLGGGKFTRPAGTAGSPPTAPVTSAAASAAPGGSGAPPPKAAPGAAAPTPAPLALAGPIPLTGTGKASGGPPSLLLLLLLAITFISLLVSGAVLAQINGLKKDMALLNVAMSQVKKSADRSWQIKCGIFSPVPNVRPQEYMIMYEEKDGKLIQKQLIIKPMEEKE